MALDDMIRKSMDMVDAANKREQEKHNLMMRNAGSSRDDQLWKEKLDRIDSQNKEKNLMKENQFNRDAKASSDDKMLQRYRGMDSRYLDAAKIKAGYVLDADGNPTPMDPSMMGGYDPYVGGGGGLRNMGGSGGRKIPLSPAQEHMELFKSNGPKDQTPGQIMAAREKFYSTAPTPGAAGALKDTSGLVKAPGVQGPPVPGMQPAAPTPAPLTETSARAYGANYATNAAERTRLRGERQKAAGYTPTPNGPGYGYYNNEPPPAVGTYINGPGGLTEVTSDVQATLRPSGSPAAASPSAAEDMSYQRMVPRMQGEQIAQFKRGDGTAFFANTGAMQQDVPAVPAPRPASVAYPESQRAPRTPFVASDIASSLRTMKKTADPVIDEVPSGLAAAGWGNIYNRMSPAFSNLPPWTDITLGPGRTRQEDPEFVSIPGGLLEEPTSKMKLRDRAGYNINRKSPFSGKKQRGLRGLDQPDYRYY